MHYCTDYLLAKGFFNIIHDLFDVKVIVDLIGFIPEIKKDDLHLNSKYLRKEDFLADFDLTMIVSEGITVITGEN